MNWYVQHGIVAIEASVMS